ERRGRSQDHFLPELGGRAARDDVAVALVGAREPALHDGTMSGRRTPKPVSIDALPRAGGGKRASPTTANPDPKPAAKGPRRRRRAAGFEERIGYRFKDPALLEQALTHISALTGARNRAGSYQRLEFLA